MNMIIHLIIQQPMNQLIQRNTQIITSMISDHQMIQVRLSLVEKENYIKLYIIHQTLKELNTTKITKIDLYLNSLQHYQLSVNLINTTSHDQIQSINVNQRLNQYSSTTSPSDIPPEHIHIPLPIILSPTPFSADSLDPPAQQLTVKQQINDKCNPIISSIHSNMSNQVQQPPQLQQESTTFAYLPNQSHKQLQNRIVVNDQSKTKTIKTLPKLNFDTLPHFSLHNHHQLCVSDNKNDINNDIITNIVLNKPSIHNGQQNNKDNNLSDNKSSDEIQLNVNTSNIIKSHKIYNKVEKIQDQTDDVEIKTKKFGDHVIQLKILSSFQKSDRKE